MKHTPLPWLVHEWAGKYQVVEAAVRTTKRPGITFTGQHILAKEIDLKANAVLMALAPEMLFALHQAKEVMEVSEVIYAMEPQVGKEPYINICRIIDKAEGR